MNFGRSAQVEKQMSQSTRQFHAKALPIAILLFACFYILSGYRGWLLLLIGTAGLWLLAYLWVRALAGGLHLNRQARAPAATAGQLVEERLNLRNDSRLPAVWVEIIDRSSNLLDPIKLVSGVGGRSSRTRWPRHRFSRRGVYSLGPTRIRTGDPFGVFSLTTENPSSESLIVLAPTVEIRRPRSARSGWAGEGAANSRSAARVVSQAGVQEYVAGDSLRRIHWPATAHRGKLVVRQLESITSRDWWILLDLDRSAHVGTGLDSTLELGVVTAASLVSMGSREGRKVGLACFGSEPTMIPLGSGERHWWAIQRALAAAGPGTSTLERLLRAVPAGARSQATMLLVTASDHPGWVSRLRPGDRGGGTTVHLLDGTGFGGAPPRAAERALTRRAIEHVLVGRQSLLAAYPELTGARRAGSLADRVLAMDASGHPAT